MNAHDRDLTGSDLAKLHYGDGDFAVGEGGDGKGRVHWEGAEARAFRGIYGDEICGAIGNVDLAGGVDIEIFGESWGGWSGFGGGGCGGGRRRTDGQQFVFFGIEYLQTLGSENVEFVSRADLYGAKSCADFGEQAALGG